MNTTYFKGALLALLAFTIYAFGDVFTKLAGLDGVSVPFIIALSGWSGVFTMLGYAAFKKNLKILIPTKWKLILVLSVMIVAQSFSNVLSFTNLPLTTVYIGLFSMPFLTALIGMLFMGEKVNKKQGASIVLGFLGVVVALLPEFLSTQEIVTEGDPVIGYIALPLFVGGVTAMMLMVRHIGKTETSESITFITVLFRSLVLTPFFFIETPPSLSPNNVIYILLMGFLMISGFLIMARSFQLTPLSIAAPFQYTQLITGAIMGYAIWSTVPSLWVFAGGALVTVAGLLTTHDAHTQDKIARLTTDATT